MRVFKLRAFAKFCAGERLPDAALLEAVKRAESGLIDADLGGGVIKQRIARTGQGRSGGYRTIILLKYGMRAVFAYGFAKNERDNIDRAELAAFRKLAHQYLGYDDRGVESLLQVGEWIEVRADDGENEKIQEQNPRGDS